MVGRTGRRRQRRRRLNSDTSTLIGDGCDTLDGLLEWMSLAGWQGSDGLSPAVFSIGDDVSEVRGLKATRFISSNSVLVSIPRQLLMTSTTSLSSPVGPLLRRLTPRPSGHLALALLLVHELHLAEGSLWRPYLRSLPADYSTPAYLRRTEVSGRFIPESLLADVIGRREHMLEEFCRVRAELQTGDALHSCNSFDFNAFRYAWSTVDTRAVFYPGGVDSQKRKYSAEIVVEDTSALAPFLDLLNHSAHAPAMCVQLSPDGYELLTASETAAGEQTFISYGPHDGRRLWLDYGFVVADNPHEGVPVSAEELQLSGSSRRQAARLGLLGALAVDRGGLSWSLVACLWLKRDDVGANATAIWRMSSELMLDSDVVRRDAARLLAAVYRRIIECLRAQDSALKTPSDSMLVCRRLLVIWKEILELYILQSTCDSGYDCDYVVKLSANVPVVRL